MVDKVLLTVVYCLHEQNATIKLVSLHFKERLIMLFATKLQSVNDNLVNLADEINELEQRLEQLREEKKQLENFAQHLQSAEAAAESALQQLNTAVKMVRAVDENELANFKEAVDSIFALNIEYLEDARHEETPMRGQASCPSPFVPSGRDNKGKQVVRTEEKEGDPVPVVEIVLDEEESIALTPEELDKKFSFAQLKRIAEAMNIKPTGRKKIDIAKAISEEGMTVEAAQEILQ